VGTFLIGCVVLVVVGGSGMLAEASQHNKQKLSGTNEKDNLEGGDGDVEIRGLGGPDDIEGGSGDAVIYGGGGDDSLSGGDGKDVLYGGDGNDELGLDVRNDEQPDKVYCGKGKDTYVVAKDIYIVDEIDYVDSSCEKIVNSFQLGNKLGNPWSDVASSSATSSASASPVPVPPSGGPAILLPSAALLLGSGILTYAILRRR
jgi:hypothetical protein